MAKRVRAPKAKDGELKAQWGKIRWNDPDLCYAWGNGISKSDAHLLHDFLTRKNFDHGTHEIEPSFVDELEARGYDITTLKFSIQKKGGNEKS